MKKEKVTSQDLVDAWYELENMMWRMNDMTLNGSRARDQYAHWRLVYEEFKRFERMFWMLFGKD